MRRAALKVACAVVGTGVAVAMAASGSAGPPSDTGTSMTLTATLEDRAVLRPDPNGMWGYWGEINSPEPDQSGSYRATCVALGQGSAPLVRRPVYTGQVRAAAPVDDRLTCNVLVLFGGDTAPFGGSLVVQGIVERPSGSELFATESPRLLAVTGGTGLKYEAKQGKAKPIGQHRIVVNYK